MFQIIRRFNQKYQIVATACILFVFLSPDEAIGQSGEQELGHVPVLRQALADPELKGYELFSQVLEIPPSFTDTVAHRHDAELFGYVLEGSVKVKLKGRPAAIFRQGEMFYEPRNILHTRLQNMEGNRLSKILLFYIIKEGRSEYQKEYD